VGPFRTVPASQTESGMVELKLVDGGWEEFSTIIFGGSRSSEDDWVRLI
jgi:carboxypeptidase D